MLSEENDLKSTNLFGKVEFIPIGADDIQRLYRQTQNAIIREFIFDKKTVVPEVRGVKEAYLGFLSAKDFLKLIRDEERSEEHTSELQSLMRISYAVFCLKKKKNQNN